MRHLRALALSGVFTSLLMFCWSTASADIVFATGDHAQSNQLSDGTSVAFSTVATTLDGEDTLIVNPSGAPAPSVGAPDRSVDNISISTPGKTFTDLIGDIYGVYDQQLGGSGCSLSGNPNGPCRPLLFTVHANDGTFTFNYSDFGSVDSTCCGNNWFTILATNGETISSVDIGGLDFNNQAKFYALADVSVSGPQAVSSPVPEPSSLLLLGSGMLAAAGAVRKRRR
jgi:hypothetical protein